MGDGCSPCWIRFLNPGLVESAIAVPQQTFGGRFLHSSIPAMAAAYLFHLVDNHAFEDGNKRVGAGDSLVFLKMNAHSFTATESEFFDLILQVARGETGKDEVIRFFEEHSRPL